MGERTFRIFANFKRLVYRIIHMIFSDGRVYVASLYVREYAHSAVTIFTFCCTLVCVLLQDVKYLVCMILQLFAPFLPYFMCCFIDHYSPRFCYSACCVFYLFLCATSCYFLMDKA